MTLSVSLHPFFHQGQVEVALCFAQGRSAGTAFGIAEIGLQRDFVGIQITVKRFT